MVFPNAERPRSSWCMENAGACTVYAKRYPNRRQPSRQLFVNLLNQLRETGSVTPRKRNRRKPVTGEEGQINVLAVDAVDPHIVSVQSHEKWLEATKCTLLSPEA
ncbi:hypothetical protein ANN_27921 [Periplaneta americana]|uniref:DUF4817 domain-containing protein n=1 Tax=Periplaneta americana TaxID=6978 RepID=A0ABQ8RVL4_PERAM|nr:hypothetical protein ANN_27921 [Periplaneta americana]